ncbi:extracellular solute-binding protein [Pseudooceanicola sp. 216_PA32_1]|uniref:Extracellular solute-binding protein n=2 Tax=Pseudooceanicola pacificus TaxID=2676438 RepID=A0A844WED3_9RHOB|nr:extracellular solute-binding protein [Pseudooceanicola pacificus]
MTVSGRVHRPEIKDAGPAIRAQGGTTMHYTRLAAAVLGAFVATGASAQTSTDELYEKAKAEGEVTWYVAQFTTSIAEDIGQDFTNAYPGVNVNVIRATGQVVYSRLAQDLRNGVAQADVFSGSDQTHLISLKEEGNLLQFSPENGPKLRKPYLDFEPDGYWYTTSANPTVMAYNTDLVTAEEAPTNWTGLVDPKWKGKVAMSHPGFSGSTGSWAVLMRRLYGDEFFEQLEANDPLIGRSLSDPPNTLVAGERAIGIGTLATVTRLKNAGNPIEIIYPEDGAKLTLSGTAIPANAPHPNAAQLFVNYLLSERASDLMVTYGLQPMRPEVAPPPGAKAIDEINLASPTQDELINGVQPVIELWRRVFGA